MCQDSGIKGVFIDSCTKGNTSSYGYCSCAFDYLANRYACDDFGNVTYNVLHDAACSCSTACKVSAPDGLLDLDVASKAIQPLEQ
jgi:hypothetical protein